MNAIVLFLVGSLALVWAIFALAVAKAGWLVMYQVTIDLIELHRRWQQAGIDSDRQRLELLTWHNRARYELQAQRRKLLED